jgi:predicted DsbA family dithiol-disulfide isomerase
MEDQLTPIRIDIVSDVMCPWCYVGKKNLEAALPDLDGVEISVNWRPYQLDPTLPAEGKDRTRYMIDKFGDPERIRGAHERLEQMGRQIGIDFRFDDIRIAPNTLDAHRLIRWAGGRDAQTQDKVVSRLFELYFSQGANVGDAALLVQVAVEAGMDGALVAELLASDADRDEVRREIDHARQIGVTGVPCFILEGRHAVMGAQPPQTIAQAIRQVAAQKAKTPDRTAFDGD